MAMNNKRFDPLLRTQPWKVLAVFSPLERVLHRLEVDGTVEAAGRQIVFKEDGKGGWYDLPAALEGVVQFHELATLKHGIPADVDAMRRLGNKLNSGSPIFESDVSAVRSCILSCKQQAMKLRASQAQSLVDTVRISAELDRINSQKVVA